MDKEEDSGRKPWLLFAIGNSGREDDGLGWAFAAEVERLDLFPGEVIYCYQLQVEDAERVSRAEKVFFVDASKRELPEGYKWEKVMPFATFEFSTHAISPASVLYLASELYESEPEAWGLWIEGQNWELRNGLSEAASANLEKALLFFQNLMVKI